MFCFCSGSFVININHNLDKPQGQKIRISFALHLHNWYNKSVLGIRLKTSLLSNIFFGRKMHPSVRGKAICIGPKSMFWFNKHNLPVKISIK